jgi:hypothetical protein
MILMDRSCPTRAARAAHFLSAMPDPEASPESWERRSKSEHSIDD